MNPLEFLRLKPAMEQFRENHPKLLPFLQAASKAQFLDEGSVIEITATNSRGKQIATNIRVKSDDLEFLGEIKKLL